MNILKKLFSAVEIIEKMVHLMNRLFQNGWIILQDSGKDGSLPDITVVDLSASSADVSAHLPSIASGNNPFISSIYSIFLTTFPVTIPCVLHHHLNYSVSYSILLFLFMKRNPFLSDSSIAIKYRINPNGS